MSGVKKFPTNVFPDVERNAFKKFSKKNVTEDYIKENLRRMGWSCYSPFTDTGLDIVATKEVNGELIYRYIQVKTRSLDSDGRFGYTLKSKDFETECRKFFFLYCDTVDDVIIIPMLDYLKLCDKHYGMGVSHFGGPSFRNNNNKLNGLTCKLATNGSDNNVWTWSYAKRDGNPAGVIDFSDYLNDNGLKKMEDYSLDAEINRLNDEIANLKFKLFYRFAKTRKNKTLFTASNKNGIEITSFIEKRKEMPESEYVSEISKIEDDLKSEHLELFESHKRYLIEDMLSGGRDD